MTIIKRYLVGSYSALFNKKIFKRILSFLGNTLFIFTLILMAILLYSLLYSKLTGQVPQVLGHKMYVVISDSMKPTFSAGSIVIVNNVKSEEIKTGNIITFTSPKNDGIITHRVVGINEGGFVTKGDANNGNDQNLLNPSNVIGRVVLSIPYLGFFLEFVRTKAGILLFVILPLTVVFIAELRKIYLYITLETSSGNKN